MLTRIPRNRPLERVPALVVTSPRPAAIKLALMECNPTSPPAAMREGLRVETQLQHPVKALKIRAGTIALLTLGQPARIAAHLLLAAEPPPKRARGQAAQSTRGVKEQPQPQSRIFTVLPMKRLQRMRVTSRQPVHTPMS